MFGSYSRYSLIPEDGEIEDTELKRNDRVRSRTALDSFLSARYMLFISIVLNGFLLTYVLYTRIREALPDSSGSFQGLYSPVQDEISYKLQTFEASFHPDGLFSGLPTPEIDSRWKQLYRVGNSRLTKSEAARLPNQTIAATPGVDDDYLVVISVFHDLHCLDRLRQTLWYFHDPAWNSTHNPFTVERPAAFADEDGLNGIIHLDHCVNILRQSLQCASDVTPYVFQWNDEAQEVRAQANVVHVCRDFDAIRDWALDRTYTGDWNGEEWRDQQGGCRSGEEGECLRVGLSERL